MTINPRKAVMARSTSHTVPNQVDNKIPPTLAHLVGNTANQTSARPLTANKILHILRILKTPIIVPTPAKVSNINILLNTIRHIQVNQVDMTLITPRHLYLLTLASRVVYQGVIHRRLTVVLDMATKDMEGKDMVSKDSREDMGSRAHRMEVLGPLLHRDGGPDLAIRIASNE